MQEQLSSEVSFFDPFALEGSQEFNPLESHAAITERYLNNEVEHDYTVDQFVADTEALIMDAQVVGMFEQASAIANQMHAMCGDHNPDLQQSMRNSSIFGEQHGNDDGHGHEHSDDDDEDDPKNKKKKRYRGWLSLLGTK